MEMDLKNIIEKIKEEGVGEAEKKAADIVDRAEDKAKGIVNTAEEKKENIVKTAEKEADKLRRNAEAAINQAARDTILGLREKIITLFDKVMKNEIEEHLSTNVIKDIIIRLAQDFKEERKTEIEVLLGKKDVEKLEKVLLAELKGEMKKGITLKAAPGIEAGFRIGEKGKDSYYDFSDEAIAETFKVFLNPKIAKLLDPISH
jgi:V/A-type H+-transporting ATPase subunit E